jgi:uncharacterized protein YyaL (SSP411 family)
MSVWLTPELQPFVGGTYFPPDERYGHPSFNSVLEKIAAAWQLDAEKITAQGARIVDALREAQAARGSAPGSIDVAVLEAAYEQFSSNYDAKEGGFGNAPKFPHPVTLNFLTRFHARRCGIGFQPMSLHRQDADATAEAKRALEMHSFTLRKMAAGGMHDHLGGGFHRYAVDRAWHVPHFEKMLYDQAQLAMAYLEGFQITGNPNNEAVVRDVLDYVARDMTSAKGGFYSAEDADSLEGAAKSDSGHAARREGAFYVWTKEEIDSALGPDAGIFAFHYGVQPDGNAPPGSDPHQEFEGKNILIQRHTIGHTAAHFKENEDKIRQILDRSRETLLTIRSKRSRPHLDDKIIAAWNGLMISAYARAGAVLQEDRYLKAAERAADFVVSQLYDGKFLFRSYREGRSEIQGFADDYAFVIQGLLDLYEASFDPKWLKIAVELQEAQDRLFLDRENGGYFSTSGNDRNVVLRMKDENDGAEPAPSSVAALNLLRLTQIQNRPEWREQAEKTIGAFEATLTRFPSAMPQMLVAFDFLSSRPRQIVIAGKAEAADTRALVAEVHRHFVPNKIVLLADDGEGQKYLGEKSEAIREMKMVDGKAAAYVCENFTCAAPVTDAGALREMLSR